MFKDYYKILNVDLQASQSEIKSAYRRLSKKWHPDRNPGQDVTAIMQDINEAFAILKDESKRIRYNNEYIRFCNCHMNYPSESASSSNPYNNVNISSNIYDFDVTDENLKEDIKHAQEFAKAIVFEFMISCKKASINAAKGSWDGAKGYIIGGVLASILFSLIKMCH